MTKVVFVVLVLLCTNCRAQISMDSLFNLKALESIGKPFPVFCGNFEGKEISNDQLKNKIVFINFWFEACPPCIAELPALNALYKKFRLDSNFVFLSFTYESADRIKVLKKKYAIDYVVASVSTQECYRLNQNNGFPTTIILDGNQKIIYLFTGGERSNKEATDYIKSHEIPAIESALKNNVVNSR